jgi:hypothetical protein
MMAKRRLIINSGIRESLNKLLGYEATTHAHARGQITGFNSQGEKKAQTGKPV